MAFNPDQTAAPFRYLVQINLDSVTLRYAEGGDLARSDGTLWKGLLIPNTTIRRSLGSLIEAKYIAQSFALQLANNDDAVRQDLDRYQWANRPVIIYIGHGTNSADYTELARGVVRFPGGVQYIQNYAYITCDDPREKHELMLPATRFDPATFPNMETRSKYKPIPRVYGDWTSGVGGGIAVPAYQIDSTIGTGGRFQFAAHSVKQIELVKKNGVSVSFSSADTTNARFVLDVTYTPGTDVITVHCQGATDDGTPTGTLLKNAALVLKDILKTLLGLTDSDLNLTAFSDYQTNATESVRRWIGGEQVSSSTLIQQLLNETWCDLPIESNQYKPVYRVVSTDPDLPTYYDYDIRRGGGGPEGQSDFRVVRDPDRLYANRIIGKYQHDPSAGTFGVVYQFDDAAAQTDVATVRQRDLNFYWMYVQADVQIRVQREVFVFGTAEVEILNTTLLSRAIQKGPTNQFRLIFDKYGAGGVGDPFQVRSSEITFGQMVNRVVAWNMLNLSPGRWTGSSAPTWPLSTAYERSVQGYHTDANGYADPSGSPDPISKRSRWF